jgi:UDP-N-acetylmuramoyl-L-alanyl-D-glutamate--2,6-diaminopimelate ligase
VEGPAEATLTGLTCDSREVSPGDAFFALRGFREDGRRFVPEAVARGAAAVFSHAGPEEAAPGIPWVVCPRDRESFSAAAAALFATRELPVKLAGVTGTNGKTTVAYLLRSIFKQAGGCGLLGTIEYDDGKGLTPAARTTPEAHQIHAWIHNLAQGGTPFGAMEVSSHSLILHRVRDVTLAAAAFTNLTRDHLDFHETMEAYFQAKRRIFDLLSPGGTAILNLEDGYGLRLASELEKPRILTVGLSKPAQVRPRRHTMDLQGIRGTFSTPFGEVEVRSSLLGNFNLQNLLVATGAALAAGATPEQAAAGIQAMPGVPGRVERVDAGQPFTVIVDYAHTDDALKNLLSTLRDLGPRRLITVFGCGGDRDRSKRPLMGAMAARLSDAILLTSDNPRSEDPSAIAADAEAGLRPELTPKKEFRCVLDRREALGEALRLARPGDVVVVAGKGHERTQTARGRVRPFHDPTVLREILGEMGWAG